MQYIKRCILITSFSTKMPFLLQTYHQKSVQGKRHTSCFSTVNGLLKPPDNTTHLNLSDKRFLAFLLAIHQRLTYLITEQKEPCSLNTLDPPHNNAFCGFSLPTESHILDLIIKYNSSTCQLDSVPTRFNEGVPALY